MNPGLEILCNRLLGALFNGGYQGLVLAAAVWLGLKMVRRANAATRHMVWLVTLLFVAALPAIHFRLPGPVEKAALPQRDSVGKEQPRPKRTHRGSRTDHLMASAKTRDAENAVRSDSANPQNAFALKRDPKRIEARDHRFGADARSSPRLLLVPFGIPARDLELLLRRLPPDAAAESLHAIQAEPGLSTESSSSVNRRSDSNDQPAGLWPMIPWSWQLSLPDWVGVLLVGLWIVLTGLRLGSLAWQWGWLHSLKRRGTSAPEDLRTRFESLSGEMGMKRKPSLMMCSESSAPMVVGLGRPTVLLPANVFQGAAEAELEQVLRHELAHVGRGDDWTNLIQQVIHALLFFHPAVWWISRQLTLEREIACDDHVLAATPTPRAYALFLTEFAGRRQCRALPAAPAAWSNKSQLKERIAMILDSNRNTSPRLAHARVGVLTAAAALVSILGLHAGPRLVLAEDSPETKSTAVSAIEAEPPAPQEPVLAAIEDTAPTSAIAESGPREKPEPIPNPTPKPPPTQRRHPVPSAPLVGPVPSLAPLPPPPTLRVHGPELAAPSVLVAPPAGPMIIAAPAGAHPPQPRQVAQASSRPRSPGEDSLERRLERLERLVESLMAREKGAKKRADLELEHGRDIHLKGPMGDFAKDKEKFAKMAEAHAKLVEKMDKFGPSPEELARIKEQASRDAERAARDVARAARDAERAANETRQRAVREAERAKMNERRAQADPSRNWDGEGLEKRRQALEEQRHALEKQMEALRRQIERLEEERAEIETKRFDQEKKQKPSNKNVDSPKRLNPEADEKAKAKF